MFFRRESPRQLSFDEKITSTKSYGFEATKASGGIRISRKGLGAWVKEGPGGVPDAGEPGLLVGDYIAGLVDGGYQKFFLTQDNHKIPALAEHLKAIHAFQEDLFEALGLTSIHR